MPGLEGNSVRDICIGKLVGGAVSSLEIDDGFENSAELCVELVFISTDELRVGFISDG